MHIPVPHISIFNSKLEYILRMEQCKPILTELF